jgi:cytochrome P450
VLRPIVGEGLLTAEGDSWRWQRKLASPLFRHTELLSYVPVMVEAADELIARWRQQAPEFTSNIEEDMTETTFSVIARTILAGINKADGDAIKRAGRAYLDPITWEVAASLLMLPEAMWHPGKQRMRKAAAQSRAIVHRLLNQRRQNIATSDDLLARMLAARNPDTGQPMSDDNIVDNLTTFLLAGHETTAKALTWTLYILARLPDWQQRLRAEVAAAVGLERIGAETIAKLPLLSRFLKESMRLYPPVPIMTRVTTEDIVIGGKHLPKPTLIVIPIFAVHRHRLLWDEPDRFDPDRFLPEKEAGYPRTQFMPFGFGQRVCIGSSFANIEAITILAALLQSARFEWDGRHEPEPVSRVTLRPKGGMPLIVKPI